VRARQRAAAEAPPGLAYQVTIAPPACAIEAPQLAIEAPRRSLADLRALAAEHGYDIGPNPYDTLED
jgi:hypothetical protein